MRLSTRALMIVVVIGVLGGAVYSARGVWRPWIEALQRPAIPEAKPYRPATPVVTRSTTTSETKPATSTKPRRPDPVTPSVADPFAFDAIRPAEVNLAVPFMLQAPKQNWDMPYQEACEEASLLMVRAFLQGRSTDFSADEADRLLLDLVAYETNQNDPPDVTLKRIGEIAEARYGFRPVLKPITSIEQIKNAVANGYPVITPASGKALKNPNFRNGGPPYHMLVVKGYLRDGRLVTNDPGTRKGKDYVYEPTLFFGAIHDWNGGNVPQGEKVVLVLLPKE